MTVLTLEPPINERQGQRSAVVHRRTLARCAMGASLWLACTTAVAQTTATAAPQGPVLSISAQASTDVNKDLATALFAVERDGPLPGPVQAQVNEVLAGAMAELKADSRLKVSSGHYNTYARNDRNGKIQGWRVRAELRAESADMDAISQASDKLAARMPLASLGFSLSKAAHERVERSLMQEAAEHFYQKARDAAKALGYADVELIEVSYNQANPGTPAPRLMAARAEAASLPIEPGQAQVSVSFSGRVLLKR